MSGVWINHLPPACWSTFWKWNFKQQLGCRFDIMDNESYFLCFDIRLYMSWYITSFFGFTFLNIHFFSSTPVLTSSIDVVFILSILSNVSFNQWMWQSFVKITALLPILWQANTSVIVNLSLRCTTHTSVINIIYGIFSNQNYSRDYRQISSDLHRKSTAYSKSHVRLFLVACWLYEYCL